MIAFWKQVISKCRKLPNPSDKSKLIMTVFIMGQLSHTHNSNLFIAPTDTILWDSELNLSDTNELRDSLCLNMCALKLFVSLNINVQSCSSLVWEMMWFNLCVRNVCCNPRPDIYIFTHLQVYFQELLKWNRVFHCWNRIVQFSVCELSLCTEFACSMIWNWICVHIAHSDSKKQQRDSSTALSCSFLLCLFYLSSILFLNVSHFISFVWCCCVSGCMLSIDIWLSELPHNNTQNKQSLGFYEFVVITLRHVSIPPPRLGGIFANLEENTFFAVCKGLNSFQKLA